MHRVDLSFPPLGHAVVSLTHANLVGGLAAHELELAGKLSATWLKGEKDAAPLLLTGRISSSHQSPRFVAHLPAQVVGLRRFAVTERFRISLTDEQVHALEQGRGSGDLVLEMHLEGTLVAAPPDLYPKAEADVRVRIPESDWTRDLDQLGGVLALTVRVPSPLLEPGALPAAAPEDATIASRSQVAGRLRHARALLMDGQLEPCAMMCRLALDNLDMLDPVARLADLPKPRDRTLDERWAAERHDLRSVLSGALHDDEVTQHFRWTRKQAEAAFAITCALVTLATD